MKGEVRGVVRGGRELRGGEQKEDELEILGMTYGGYNKKPASVALKKCTPNLYFIWYIL